MNKKDKLKVEIEKPEPKEFELLKENRELRKANLSFALNQIRQEKLYYLFYHFCGDRCASTQNQSQRGEVITP